MRDAPEIKGGLSLAPGFPPGKRRRRSLRERLLRATEEAESGALTLVTPNIDPALASLIDAWRNLLEPIKAAIRALVGSATSPS